MKSKVVLKNGMHFVGELDGFEIPIDADEQFGGRNLGPKPKGLVLTSLIGCTAMDVISILRKIKAEPDEFGVEAEDVADLHSLIQPALLGQVADPIVGRGKGLAAQHADPTGAGVRMVNAHDHAQRGRLSRPVRTDESVDRALGNRK